MDVLTLISTVLRRWYVVAPILVIAAAAILVTVDRTEQMYELHGSYLVGAESVADPRERAVPEPDVDTAFDADVDLVPGVSVGELIADAESDEFRRQLAGEAGDADYAVQHSGQVLRVIATGSDREALIPTVRGVMEHLEAQIEERQESEEVGSEERARVQVLTVPTDASIRSADDQPEDEAGSDPEAESGSEGEPAADDEVDADGTYRAMGSLHVTTALDEGVNNPYAAPYFTLRLLQELLQSPEGAERVAEAGGRLRGSALAPEDAATGGQQAPDAEDPGYALTFADRDAAPIAYVMVTGPDKDAVEGTYHAVVEVVSDELAARQATLGVPSTQQIRLHRLSVPAEAGALPRDMRRTLITIAGLGAATAIGLALLAENVAHGLRRRRHRPAAEPTAGVSAPDGSLVADDASPPDNGRPSHPHARLP